MILVRVRFAEWEPRRPREAFEGFRSDPEVQETMRAGGAQGPPEAHVLEVVGELPA